MYILGLRTATAALATATRARLFLTAYVGACCICVALWRIRTSLRVVVALLHIGTRVAQKWYMLLHCSIGGAFLHNEVLLGHRGGAFV